MSDEDPILICCPYCLSSVGSIEEPDQPFAMPSKCKRCEMDPRNDAPFEMAMSSWAAMATKSCAACGKAVPVLAVRCRHCKNPTSSSKKAAPKKAAPKKAAPKKAAPKKAAPKKAAPKKAAPK